MSRIKLMKNAVVSNSLSQSKILNHRKQTDIAANTRWLYSGIRLKKLQIKTKVFKIR